MRVYTLALSVIAHLLVLTLVVVIPLLATDVLPNPHRVLEFVQVMPAVIQPPPVLRSREQPRPDPRPSNAVPLEEPEGVQPEVQPEIPEPFDAPASLIEGVGLHGDTLGGDPVPPPPPPRDREPVRVGGAITRPERVHYVSPVYPAIARAAHVEGTVILEAVIGADGAVRELRVLRSVSLLDSAAIEAVRQWRFSPTRLNGEPIPVVMTVTVTFTLQ